MEDGFLSQSLGSKQTATHLLTHCSWNSMPEYFSRGSNETGVRDVVKGEVIKDSFRLIQHGWHDWRKAGDVIEKLLAKNKSIGRIADIMEYIKQRGWVNRPPKAKTL